MDPERVQVVNAFIEPWGLRIAQDALLFMESLRKTDIAESELLEFINEIREMALAKQEALKEGRKEYVRNYNERAPKCPECGFAMLLDEVNHKPCCMIGGTSKSVWRCPDPVKCGHEDYQDATALEQVLKYKLEAFYAHYLPSNQKLREAYKRAQENRRNEERKALDDKISQDGSSSKRQRGAAARAAASAPRRSCCGGNR